MPHIVPLKGNYRKKKQVKITSTVSSPLFDYQAQVNTSDNTKLIIRGNGINTSTSITDSSLYPKTITVNGNTQVSTAQGKLNGSSIAFDGTGDYLSIPYSNDFDFTVNNYTVDCWFRTSSLATIQHIFGVNKSDKTGNNCVAYVYTTGSVAIGLAGVNEIVTTTGLISTNTWYHIAFVKNGSTTKIYINGVEKATGTTGVWDNPGNPLLIGGVGYTTDKYMNGYLDEIRFTKDASLWNSDFTPPALPYIQDKITNESGLVASYHFNEGSGTVAKDSSPNKNDGTITNGTYVQGQFGTALSFNGSSSGVSIPDNATIQPTTALSIETLVKFIALPGTNTDAQFVAKWATGTPQRSYRLGLQDTSGTKSLKLGVSSAGSSTVEATHNWTPVVGTLYHLVCTWNAGTYIFYIDGVQVATGTTTGVTSLYDNTEVLRLGRSGDGGYFNGYMEYSKIFSRCLTPQEIKDRYNASIRPDYQDLRFMDGQNKLKHWIEQDGKAWVKVPQIPANSSKTIDMYYGNYSALDVQDKDGLVAYYPLDGNSKDFAGGNHGTDTSVTYGAGKFGQCGIYSSSHTDLPTNSQNIVGHFTISHWIKTSSGGPGTIFGNTNTTGGVVYAGIITNIGYTTSGKIDFEIMRNTGNAINTDYKILTSSATFNDNSWNLVTAVYDGSNMTIYKNGVYDNSVAWTYNAGYKASMLPKLGRTSDSYTPFDYSGSLDDVRIYNRALSADEIKSLYNQGFTTTISEKPEAVKGFLGKLIMYVGSAVADTSKMFFKFFSR